MQKERTGLVTMGGNPVTLLGPELKPGDAAPDFEVADNALKPVRLGDFKNQVLVVSVVPSLDTPTCDTQTRRFNQEATALGDKVKVLTISMDLPFAQKRWCGAAGVERVQTLSDHRLASFGQNWGVLLKDVRLLARAVFVVDAKGVIRHAQLVKEIRNEPDYASVLNTVKELV